MSAIKALGYSGITLKIELIKKILETIILIVSFLIGIYAVAWGIVLYNFICIVINLYPCKKLLNYGVMEQIKDILPYILLSGTMGGLLYALSLLDLRPALLITIQVTAGFILYITLNAVFGTNSYKYAKNILTEKITNRLLQHSI